MVTEKETTAETLAKGRTLGAFRCLNCFVRITAFSGAKTCKCPNCGFEWRLFWIDPEFPRIRGPVWAVNRGLAEEAAIKKGMAEGTVAKKEKERGRYGAQ